MSRYRSLIILILLVFFSRIVNADTISICSFNIQFLGNSTIRDNMALTDILEGYDIVVIQELVAPPYSGRYPNGKKFKPDPESAEFFDHMVQNNFDYILSEEDTGPGTKNHNNSIATEWWVVFYKNNKVKPADDLPQGFIAKDRTANRNYDRVPYAFAFRAVSNNLDFVLISVHLRPNGKTTVENDRNRRYNELHSIHRWIIKNKSSEKDFIILGDMNIEDKEELDNLDLDGYTSLYSNCVRTNTIINLNVNAGAKPYDHVMYNVAHTSNEIDMDYGFKVINLINSMKPYWTSISPYPGNYNFKGAHDLFRQYYSDHHPVVFQMVEPSFDDD